jgi:hypothetical protein
MKSSSRPTRKRKQAELFSPLSRQEEKTIMQALHTSLRRIPLDGTTSEDDCDDDEEELEQEEDDENFIDDEKKGDDYELKWSQRRVRVKVAEFNQESGPTKVLSSQQTVKSFFDLMFSKKIINLICTQTNIYAEQQILAKPDPSWKPLLPGELKAWIGCLLAMGLNKKPNIKMYWDQTWKLSIIADRFTRDRFLSIKKYLHLANNADIIDEKASNPDRLAKVRPLMNLLTENFQAQYRPGRYLTADEDMCKFKGRSTMKQYMKAKIIKWGYRIWKLCDATDAYVLNFDVYTGAKGEKKDTSTVVMELMEGYFDKNHVVIMDNFFTSVPLFMDLFNRSTYACGTIRSNRKYLPEEFKGEQKMNPGQSKFWQSENFVATIWQDKRLVRFLSTCCEAVGGDTVERRRKRQERVTLPCPPATKLYTLYMGGVDRSDRLIRTYSVSRMSRKWWFRLFYYFLDMAVANSFILYKSSPNHDELTELDYIKQLSLALIGTFSKDDKVQTGRKRRRERAPAIPRCTSGNHWPLKLKQRKDCDECKRKGSKRRKSYYTCGIHLCIDTCFKSYHTRR